MVPRLIRKAFRLGYEVTLGDAYRDPRCPYGSKDSDHHRRLAIDLNLFKNGVYLTRTKDHRLSPRGSFKRAANTQPVSIRTGDRTAALHHRIHRPDRFGIGCQFIAERYYLLLERDGDREALHGGQCKLRHDFGNIRVFYACIEGIQPVFLKERIEYRRTF